MLNEDSDRAREERHQSEGEHPAEDEGEIGHIPVLPEPARRRHIFYVPPTPAAEIFTLS